MFLWGNRAWIAIWGGESEVTRSRDWHKNIEGTKMANWDDEFHDHNFKLARSLHLIGLLFVSSAANSCSWSQKNGGISFSSVLKTAILTAAAVPQLNSTFCPLLSAGEVFCSSFHVSHLFRSERHIRIFQKWTAETQPSPVQFRIEPCWV